MSTYHGEIYMYSLELPQRSYSIEYPQHKFLQRNTYECGSDKRDLKGINIKINVFRQMERTGFHEHFLKI